MIVLDLLARLAQLRLERWRRGLRVQSELEGAIAQDEVSLLEIDYRQALLDLAREEGGEDKMKECGLS